MCDSHKNDKKSVKISKGDEDMNVVLKHQNEFQLTRKNAYKNLELSNNTADKLAKGKTVVKAENGVIQIGKDHPDYNFWMED